MIDTLTIALSKGRILEQTLPLLATAGLPPEEDVQHTRKLIVNGPKIENTQVRFLVLRAADVCTYVEQGAADMGIAGRDLLLEHQPHVFEPLDLQIGRCRMCICGPRELVERGKPETGSRIRVATKYDNLTRQYYLEHGIHAEVIHLYGSMELAPLVGMADRIVDIVETGSTLKANGLVEETTLFDISSRLIVNPASAATKQKLIHPIVQTLRAALQSA
ncbi:MAG: ATP phosphoribosyltransferase [Zetaproteobacteria bacterium CG_4_9_14_3_um_filter_49_83]|nr:MAG: ATP phosphoribosyltransferase [Zetaproteobacteria bacterium CG1_02_49_23]PIQ32635.1 MAG: ATP phosphoribosyltransferase [Zetaproteobacteria bacterium CG17_big_fil_post_rev_8_21_14_2_50_50_13]PIV29645.1 MAG: ATP phosphoribosyltransferase [Zetaproteobacteria bacterium CG02_land_8_20_14_3_00_50_9]PIY54699.1 MAG: ATP phosphoribosyltransferase [Zetaproteobacteria bacterium CG_4_10_14_0_8_um_filter_49_80]PJA35890.1 MAG: ATP phosphoribosyltransferase [Zetaproteobacteria bacterium CG_4_9_14_3_um